MQRQKIIRSLQFVLTVDFLASLENKVRRVFDPKTLDDPNLTWMQVQQQKNKIK